MYGDDAIESAADPGNWELWSAPTDPTVIYHAFPEFTCRCPRSGYPDFATIHLVVIPRDHVVELKTLKLYFNSFRDRRISHENAVNEIAYDYWTHVKPHYCFVLMAYTPRGNLTTFPMRERYHLDLEEQELNLARSVRDLVIANALKRS